MSVGPAQKRRNTLIALAVIVAGIGTFVLVFCRGHTGLFRIMELRRQEARLRGEVTDLKAKSALIRSDIEDYQKPEHVSQIARERLHMVPKADADSAGTAAPSVTAPKKANAKSKPDRSRK